MASDRRLAAIMFTDLAGFTAEAQKDEAGALRKLEEHEKLADSVIANHRGRRVKSMGDGLLIEFPNALDAVECSVDLQRRIHERDAPEASRRLRMRIGIHLGDVQRRGPDILGDAVNVASRIEPLAEPGGVCLSTQVYDQVRNRVPYQFESLGLRSLKGIERAVEVYRIVLPWLRPTPAQSSSRLPRVAVLPLANISPDPGDEYFADGLTEELTSTLSRIRGLRVISRTSAVRYKGTAKGAKEIGSELNVGSLVEGSVRKIGDELRVTAQLIDATSDEHLWSEQYETTLKDVFRIQKEIATNVARALEVQLLSGERIDLGKVATGSEDAYLLYLRGRQHWNRRSKEENALAIACFERAVKTDPQFGFAYVGLADAYVIAGDWGWMPPQQAFPRAEGYVLRGLEIDPTLAEAHTTLGAIFNSYYGKWSDSEREFRSAIDRNPNYALAHMWYALLLCATERYDGALEELRRARDLDPFSWLVDSNLGTVLSYSGRHGDAIGAFQSAVEKSPERPGSRANLGIEYLLASRTVEGKHELAETLRMPDVGSPLKLRIGCALGYVGEAREAERVFREIEATLEVEPLSDVDAAGLQFARNRLDEGFDLLEKARREHSLYHDHGGILPELRTRPWFAAIRESPRWAVMNRHFVTGS